MAHLSLPLKGLLQDTESKTAGYTPPTARFTQISVPILYNGKLY